MNTLNPRNHALSAALQIVGGYAALAKVCGINTSAVWRWQQRGKLPRTEWTGETHYAENIEAATGITKAALLSYVGVRDGKIN